MQSKQMLACETSELPLTVSVVCLARNFGQRTAKRKTGVHNNIDAFGGDPNNVAAIG